MRGQLARLTRPGFLIDTPYQWLAQYPRYLGAMNARLRKLLSGNRARDHKAMDDLAPFRARYEQATVHEENTPMNGSLELYKWMIEEYRVSLFAQELGTMLPVSAKRLDAQWALVEQQVSR
jgi:ATP-dependent helicase HrpA